MEKEDTYQFIDGNYLDKTLEAHGTNYFNETLIPSYRHIGHAAIKNFYYDAYPTKKKSESDQDFAIRHAAVEQKFDAIASIEGWHVNSGVTRGFGKKIRQKGVDVQLAVDAYSHCVRKNCRNVILLTGDLDFLPLIRALVQEGVWVLLWHDPNTTSKDLVRAADQRRYLNLSVVRLLVTNQLPNFSGWHSLNDERLLTKDALASASHELLKARIVQSKRDTHAFLLSRNGEKSYSMLEDPSFDRLLYYAKSEFPLLEWSTPQS